MSYGVRVFGKDDDLPMLDNANLFQSADLFRIYANTSGYDPFMVVLYRGNRPVAHLLANIRTLRHWIPISLFKRCEVIGTGSYAGGVDALEQEAMFAYMLRALTKRALSRCFLIEFRNIEKALFGYSSFRRQHYIPVNWLRIHNSLHSRNPEERLGSSRRRQIRKALRSGVEVRCASTDEEINMVSKLLRIKYAPLVRKHFPSIEFFSEVVHNRRFTETGQLFGVWYHGHVIGGCMTVFSQNNAYLLFNGGLHKKFPRLYPNVMAVWASICYAYEKGYDHVEFMDVGLPFRKVGYRNFILGFGGKQIATRRWFRFRWNWINHLLEKFYV